MHRHAVHRYCIQALTRLTDILLLLFDRRIDVADGAERAQHFTIALAIVHVHRREVLGKHLGSLRWLNVDQWFRRQLLVLLLLGQSDGRFLLGFLLFVYHLELAELFLLHFAFFLFLFHEDGFLGTTW